MKHKRLWWMRPLAPITLMGLLVPALIALAAAPSASIDPLHDLLQASDAPMRVEYHPVTGAADFFSGAVPVPGANVEARSQAFLVRYGRLFGVRDPGAELRVMREASDAAGMSHVAYEQAYHGVPVFGARLVVHIDGAGRVVAVNGQFQPDIDLASLTPAIDADAARAVVEADLGTRAVEWQGAPRLVIWTHNRGGAEARLAWELRGLSNDPLGRWHYFVDAQSGAVAYRLDELTTAKDRRVFTAFNGSGLPGTLRCVEASPVCTGNDTAAQAAFDFSGTIYDYYFDNFGRDSYDDHGAPLTSTVHYGVNVPLAFWNGNEVVFGDGNNVTSTVTAHDLDLAAHEWAHAVTEHTSNLFYEGESGALNESYADVFAVFITPTNWLIGETSYIADPVYGLRSLADPTKGGRWDPNAPATSAGQPDRLAVRAILPDQFDNGGVHINSGIPNKAAYLLVNGGTFQGVTVAGLGLTRTQQIYYRAQAFYNTPFTGFANAAQNSYQACRDLAGQFGIASGDCESVVAAWAAVGVTTIRRLYLPLVTGSGSVTVTPPPPATGITGRASEGGTAAVGITVTLAQCSSVTCTTVFVTTTVADGGYRFTPPSLPAGLFYRVQYRQSATCSRLGAWDGNWIVPFAAGERRDGGDFDISATLPLTPAGNVGGIPQTFHWVGRTLPPGMTADLPEFQLYDSSGSTLLHTQVLTRGVTSYAPPAGVVQAFHTYRWAVAVLEPHGRGDVGSVACQQMFNITSLTVPVADRPVLPRMFGRR